MSTFSLSSCLLFHFEYLLRLVLPTVDQVTWFYLITHFLNLEPYDWVTTFNLFKHHQRYQPLNVEQLNSNGHRGKACLGPSVSTHGSVPLLRWSGHWSEGHLKLPWPLETVLSSTSALQWKWLFVPTRAFLFKTTDSSSSTSVSKLYALNLLL